MFRTIRRSAVVVASALALLPATGAQADLTQVGSGTIVNTLDAAAAATQGASQNLSSPDVTCANPTVAAGPAVFPLVYVVGELYGVDAAEAHGLCMSLQGRNYTGTLKVWLEYQPTTGAAFTAVPNCSTGTATGPAVNGVLSLTTPLVTCQYRVGSAAAGKPHRAHATLVNSQVPTAVYHGYSPVVWSGGI